MRAAFKEWSVVVDALGRGEQIIILRKGGISEGRGGFRLEHSEFWLFPTLYHQQAEGVIPDVATRFRATPPPPDAETHVNLRFFARVVEAHRLESLSAAERLRGQHVWTDPVIAERFDWGAQQAIFAIAVRIYEARQVTKLPLVPAYGGCKSWIDLAAELGVEGASPVLSEEAFLDRLTGFRSALEGAPTPPA